MLALLWQRGGQLGRRGALLSRATPAALRTAELLSLHPCLTALASSRASSTAPSGSAPVIPAADLPPLSPPAPPPVPLAPGEVLLSSGGPSTRKSVLFSWLGAGVVSGYCGIVRAVEAASPGVALLSPAWAMVFAGVAAATGALAVATCRASARAVVLTADGHHVRVHPYGSLGGWGYGAPVTVPVKLLRETSGPNSKDREALYVRIRAGAGGALSRVPFVVDKPVGLPRALDAPGACVTFTPVGLDAESRARVGSGAPEHELRRYALLVWVLQGNAVANMPLLLSGQWDLDAMTAQLAAPPAGAKPAALALVHWRAAKDDAGRTYYWDELTWHTQWQPPLGWVGDGTPA